MGNYTYLLISIIILFITVLISFYRKMHLVSDIKYILISVLLCLLVFIPWEMGFTAMKILSFNDKYLLGVFIGNLPLEEYLFLISFSFICLLIYTILKGNIKRDFLRKIHFSFTPLIITGLVLLLISEIEKTHTAVSSSFLILLFLIQLINGKRYMGWFYLTYIICIIPFAIINFILTALPVIISDKSAFLNLRIGTIPVDNFIFDGAILLLLVMGYEWAKRRFPPALKSNEEDTREINPPNPL